MIEYHIGTVGAGSCLYGIYAGAHMMAISMLRSSGYGFDVDVDGVYERRPRPLCPPHVITLRFNYMLRFFI